MIFTSFLLVLMPPEIAEIPSLFTTVDF